MNQQNINNQNRLPKDNKGNKIKNNKFLQFTAVAFQMGATIFLGNYLGKWLDENYNSNFYEQVVTLIAVFVSLYLVIKQAIKASKE